MINKEKKIMNNETNKNILSEEKEESEKKINDKNDNYLAMIISRWILEKRRSRIDTSGKLYAAG